MSYVTAVGTALGSVLGAIALIVGAFFATRSFYHWLRPIRITPNILTHRHPPGPDQIIAHVTNVSREDQVLVRCVARSTYPLATILRQHLRHPLTPPRLYGTMRYVPISFSLMGAKPIRLAPAQREELKHSMSDHPLSVFLSSMIQIEVELSSGRTFRSGRLEVPEWRFVRGSAGSASQNIQTEGEVVHPLPSSDASGSADSHNLKILDHAMPDLFNALRDALKQHPFVREFFVLSSKDIQIGLTDYKRFRFNADEIPDLVGKVHTLEGHGLVRDVTPRDAPIYRMSEELVAYLKTPPRQHN